MNRNRPKFLLLVFTTISLISCKPVIEPTIENSEIINITVNSAIGVGSVDIKDEGDIVERGFCWDLAENPDVKDHRVIEGSGSGEFSVRMFNLQPNTTYFARAYVLNRSGIIYGEDISFTTKPFSAIESKQIIADHKVVDLYDQIPENYLDSVKKMLVFLGGESHAQGYRNGMKLLENLDSKFQVNTYDSEPLPELKEEALRFGQPFAIGEQIFTSDDYQELIGKHFETVFNSDNIYDVIGFGWCWDMTWVNKPGGIEDPDYRVRWAGTTAGGPDGNKRWGLDAGDSVLTENRINMDTYFHWVEDFNDICNQKDIPTVFIYTTGPVDSNSGTETGFQRELKHDRIREYVSENSTRILFDFADILIHNNSGDKHVVEWKNKGVVRYHAQIHPDNMMDYDENFNIIRWSDEDQDHIGEVGAVRLAKAMWWMLARVAGWDGQ